MCDCSCSKASAVSLGVVGSYLGLYSAYDKSTKGYNFSLLTKIFSFGDVDYSVRQLNKVGGLASLTIAGVALIPGRLSAGCEQQLLKIASGVGIVHAVASVWQYYGFSMTKMLQGKGKGYRFEVPALAFGTAGLFFMFEAAFLKNDVSAEKRARGAYAALLLTVLHFFYIETKTGLPQDLPIRPYGYMAFITSLTALGYPRLKDIACYLTGRVCRLLPFSMPCHHRA